MVRVLIPASLQQFAGGSDELEAAGSTVREVMNDLMDRHPNLKKQLYSDKGELRHFVNLYKGAEDTRSLQGMDTPVGEDEELSIVPSIAGGVAAPLKPKIVLPDPISVIEEGRAEAAELTNE